MLKRLMFGITTATAIAFAVSPAAAATPAQGQGADAGQDAGPAVSTTNQRQSGALRGFDTLADQLAQRTIRGANTIAEAGEGGGLRGDLNNQLTARNIRTFDLFGLATAIFGNGR